MSLTGTNFWVSSTFNKMKVLESPTEDDDVVRKQDISGGGIVDFDDIVNKPTFVNQISGTANEIEVDASTGNVTIGLPDNTTIMNLIVTDRMKLYEPPTEGDDVVRRHDVTDGGLIEFEHITNKPDFVNSVTGTANEIEVDASTGDITIGLPDNTTIKNLTVSDSLTSNVEISSKAGFVGANTVSALRFMTHSVSGESYLQAGTATNYVPNSGSGGTLYVGKMLTSSNPTVHFDTANRSLYVYNDLNLNKQTPNRVLTCDGSRNVATIEHTASNTSNTLVLRNSTGGTNFNSDVKGYTSFTLANNTSGCRMIVSPSVSGRSYISVGTASGGSLTPSSSGEILFTKIDDTSSSLTINTGTKQITTFGNVNLSTLTESKWLKLDASKNITTVDDPSVVTAGGTYSATEADVNNLTYEDLHLHYRRVGNLCFVGGEVTVSSADNTSYLVLTLPVVDVPQAGSDFGILQGSISLFGGVQVGTIYAGASGGYLCAEIKFTATISSASSCLLNFTFMI